MRVLVFVPELDSDLVVAESKELLAQLVVVLLVPLPSQEFDDGFSSGKKPIAVAPDAVACVGLGDFLGISRMQSERRPITKKVYH
jgi:hypothetical protein